MAKGKYQKWLEPDNLILLQGWARSGLTNDQIAHNMGITRKTLYEWMNTYDEINESLKKGKEVADYMVENALFNSALGYEVEEYEEKVTMKGDVVPTKRKRHIPPNITAQIFWLKNRRPEQWREKRDVVVEEKYEDSGLIAALMADDGSDLCDDTDMIVDDEEE